jgi:hypothetical protein
MLPFADFPAPCAPSALSIHLRGSRRVSPAPQAASLAPFPVDIEIELAGSFYVCHNRSGDARFSGRDLGGAHRDLNLENEPQDVEQGYD